MVFWLPWLYDPRRQMSVNTITLSVRQQSCFNYEECVTELGSLISLSQCVVICNSICTMNEIVLWLILPAGCIFPAINRLGNIQMIC